MCTEPDGCQPESTRCDGTTIEICNADNDWETVVDCQTEGIVCCTEPDGTTCAEECN